ncbi:high mobility group B protein 6-like [Iris pallida]|uniref:High mobility group B protein 6-like n=1 Tax=Iris pallida TaxID=29817 RepID=A0AAX6GEC3_IRIPA|nr:high mobility group B protein 6-like [Iris pallida]
MAEVTKKGKSRKALKALSASEVNASAGKENRVDGLSLLVSPNDKPIKKDISKPKAAIIATEKSLADELKDVQRRLEKLRVEKEKTEELLKQRDEMIRVKEEELEKRCKEQEKLQKEIKKLQKLKEFKPTMNFPLIKSLREKEKEKNEKKKKKDCTEKKTKKPSTPYILWCKDQWNEMKKGNPNADFKETSNLLGARWKGLSAEEKKPYEEKYQQEKEAYLQIVSKEKRENEAMKLMEDEQMQKTAMALLEQYLLFKEEAGKEGKKVKKEKDPLKPKKPVSAFFMYASDRRAALHEEAKSMVEISKIAGEEWKNMTQEKKAPYEEMAKKRMEEYNRQIELYNQKKLEDASNIEREEEEQRKIMKQEGLQLLKKKEKTENIIKKTKENRQKKKKENSHPNKPKKPASAFLIFSKETRKELSQERPEIGNSTINAMISVKWKELNEAEKEIWKELAAPAMAAYKKELECYNNSIAVSSCETVDH